MDFTKNEIREFQTIFRHYFGLDISDDEANKRLNSLIRQMAVIYQPITSKAYKDYLNSDGLAKIKLGVEQ